MFSENAMNRHKGFSLLEVLVAFSIMAVALGILLNIFSSGVNTAVIAEEYTVATQIAEGLLAKTGVETALTPGEMSGTEAEKYHWTVSIYLSPELSALAETEQQSFVLMEVTVIVEWEQSGGRRVELHTVKAGTLS